MSQLLRAFVEEVQTKVQLTINHAKRHVGHPRNELADGLAKGAAKWCCDAVWDPAGYTDTLAYGAPAVLDFNVARRWAWLPRLGPEAMAAYPPLVGQWLIAARPSPLRLPDSYRLRDYRPAAPTSEGKPEMSMTVATYNPQSLQDKVADDPQVKSYEGDRSRRPPRR